MSDECTLEKGQCCCNCRYHWEVHFHCTTEPKPTAEQKAAAGALGKCVCSVKKGYACAHPEFGELYDNWPQHSYGCELYEPKERK